MAQVKLISSQGTHQVSVVQLIGKCDLFKSNPGLTMTRYRVQSQASLEDVQDFVSALEDESIHMDNRNFPGLSQLSEEFGCQMVLMEITSRRRLPGLPDAQRLKYVSLILSLEKRVGQHEHQLEA
jgi:hypothetical protein